LPFVKPRMRVAPPLEETAKCHYFSCPECHSTLELEPERAGGVDTAYGPRVVGVLLSGQ